MVTRRNFFGGLLGFALGLFAWPKQPQPTNKAPFRRHNPMLVVDANYPRCLLTIAYGVSPKGKIADDEMDHVVLYGKEATIADLATIIARKWPHVRWEHFLLRFAPEDRRNREARQRVFKTFLFRIFRIRGLRCRKTGSHFELI